MKNKNIAFSGFMAAIMLSTGAAMAAPQIASKAYVDNKSASVATAAVTAALENGAIKTALDAKADASTVEAVKSTAETAKSTAEAANATATANKNAIENEETGLAATKTVADNAATAAANAATKASSAQAAAEAAQATANAADTKAGNAQAAATANAGEISTLKNTVAGKQDALGYTAENAANKIGTLSATASEEEQARTYPTAGAVISYVKGKFDEITEGISVDTSKIAEGAITDTKIKDGAVINEKIADGAVTEGKLSTELATKVNNAQTSEQVSAAIVDAIKNKADKADTLAGYGITDAMTETEVKGYAVPKPSTECAAESGRCVLSVDTDGLPYWMDVTSPLGE